MVQGAVTLVFQGARGHNRRHITTESHQHRDKRLSGQTDHPHEAIHDKGGARAM